MAHKVLYKNPIPAADVTTLGQICTERGYPCIIVTEKELKVVNPDSQVRMIFNEYLNVDEIAETTFEEVTSVPSMSKNSTWLMIQYSL